MTSWHRLEASLAAVWPPEGWSDVTVAVAVSGGPDSTALLRAMAALRPFSTGLVVAHFNHQLRGQESNADEAFVRQLSQDLGLVCEVGHAPRAVRTPEDGREAVARRYRYRFLRKLADRVGARYIATGHTADDQIETILHRVVRGTGLRGIAGIPRIRVLTPLTTLVRPLLGVTRAEVHSYLDDLRQPFREDSSNGQTHYTRNRIRHELLPVLRRDYNARVDQAVLRLGDLASQAQHVLDQLVARLREVTLRVRTAAELQLARSPLRDQPPFVIQELLIGLWQMQSWPLRDMNERKWRQLAELVQLPVAPRQGLTMPGNIQVTAHADRIVIVQCTPTAPRG